MPKPSKPDLRLVSAESEIYDLMKPPATTAERVRRLQMEARALAVEQVEALERALDELTQRFEPGLVIYLAGADPHEGDRLGRLKLSYDGLEARDRRVMDWAWQRRVPLAFTMAGGYGHDMETTVQVQMHTYRTALAYHQRWQAPPPAQATVRRAAHWHNAAP